MVRSAGPSPGVTALAGDSGGAHAVRETDKILVPMHHSSGVETLMTNT